MDIENNTHNHLVWLDSIGSATFVINTDHMVIYWNEACEVMTGVTANRVIDTNQHWRGFYNNERPCLADMVLDDGWEEKAELYEYIEVAKTSKRGLIARNWCQTPAGK
jgi:PAS domain-containing protein